MVFKYSIDGKNIKILWAIYNDDNTFCCDDFWNILYFDSEENARINELALLERYERLHRKRKLDDFDEYALPKKFSKK